MSSPFGIQLNAPLPPAVRISDLAGQKCSIAPPQPHPAFAEYYAEESPRFGVVWLKGVSPASENDAFGYNVRAQFEKLSTQLASRYGQPKVFDFLHNGSIWEESRYWVASLYENERSFFHVWKRANGAQIPDDLDTIFLGLLPYDHSSCAVVIEYASVSHEDAERDSDADLANLL